MKKIGMWILTNLIRSEETNRYAKELEELRNSR